ncbi:hypothetical protein GQ55_1G005000 [Panicum hallii var. hallii]|uniref:Uncharacterized protein n=1 Tax=Panicum hallii var. hallii TaxID=1504633 RepID=A0A2T7F0P8_9POAL|nr:hypothetical protein GQ55_1G005000 [Panicum hallii var. hallii]
MAFPSRRRASPAMAVPSRCSKCSKLRSLPRSSAMPSSLAGAPPRSPPAACARGAAPFPAGLSEEKLPGRPASKSSGEERAPISGARPHLRRPRPTASLLCGHPTSALPPSPASHSVSPPPSAGRR